MTAFDFGKIAETRAKDIERPPLPPVGTYVFAITKVPEQKDVNEQYFAVNFDCKAIAATSEVNSDELAQYGKLDKLRIRYSYLFDKEDPVGAQQAEANLRDFLQKKVKCLADDETIKEGLNNSVNRHFLGVVRYKARKDEPEVFDPVIGKTAPVED